MEFCKKLTTLTMACLIAFFSVLPTAAFASGVSSEAEEHILNGLSRARFPNAAVAIIQDYETSFIFKDSAQDMLF